MPPAKNLRPTNDFDWSHTLPRTPDVIFPDPSSQWLYDLSDLYLWLHLPYADTMQAWMVRAGRDGEREQYALDSERTIAGWDEVGDLSQAQTRDSIQRIIKRTYPGESNRLIGNWTGQLDRFVNQISIDDIIVMPLKTEEGQVVIGRVESEYEFIEDNDPGFQHTRRVAWDPTLISRSTLGSDIRATLGSLLTVCEIEKHNATVRLQTIMETGSDPGFGDPNGQVTSFSDLTEKAPFTVSIRKLLELVDSYRRTAGTVAILTEKLEEHKLEISRPIDSGLIDDEVEVRPANSDDPSGDEPLTDDPQENSEEFSLRVDYKVSAIQSASSIPASVAPDDTILKAQTMMLENNYSQLAVIEEQGGLYGAITWESISIASFYQTPPSGSRGTSRRPNNC